MGKYQAIFVDIDALDETEVAMPLPSYLRGGQALVRDFKGFNEPEMLKRQ